MNINKLQIYKEIKNVLFVEQKIKLPIYIFDLKNMLDNDKIIENAISYMNSNSSAGHGSLYGDGYQSSYMHDTQLFEELFIQIKERLNEIQKIAFGKTPESAHHCYDNQLIAFWIVGFNKGSEMKYHNHVFPEIPDNRRWSSVYYAKVPNNAASIVFLDGEQEIKLEPKEGRLILFSSLLLHKVETSVSNEDRISIVSNW